VDETMELPIFRELESAWFRVAESAAGVPTNGDMAPAPVDDALDSGNVVLGGDADIAETVVRHIRAYP